MKTVPGRKTDVQDAVWICDLMQHGLLKPSFIPPRPQRELVRYRISLVRERADEANRIQKVLEGGNIKLGSVVTDILGQSGRDILETMAAGGSTPKVLADLAHGKLRAKHEELVEALQGRLNDHQRMMLQVQLDHVRYLDWQIAALDAEVTKRLVPFEAQVLQRDTIPGVNQRVTSALQPGTRSAHARPPTIAWWAPRNPDRRISRTENRGLTGPSISVRPEPKAVRTVASEAAAS